MGTKTYVVQVEASRAVMLQYWGHPCPDTSRKCPICSAWARWHKNGKIVVTTTEENTLDLLLKL